MAGLRGKRNRLFAGTAHTNCKNRINSVNDYHSTLPNIRIDENRKATSHISCLEKSYILLISKKVEFKKVWGLSEKFETDIFIFQ